MRLDNTNCEYFTRCSIFNGLLKDNHALIKTYKGLFCENGREGKLSCVRHKVINEIGYCPSNILPNSKKTVEEIIGLAAEVK